MNSYNVKYVPMIERRFSDREAWYSDRHANIRGDCVDPAFPGDSVLRRATSYSDSLLL